MAAATLVIVPGAFHVPQHFDRVSKSLRDLGYPIVIEKLPSVGSLTPEKETPSSDADLVREKILLPLLERGKDIVLLVRSYGGIPGAAAAKGLSKKERLAAGEDGGILGLIFMCAFVAREGESLLGKLPNQQFLHWQNVDVCILVRLCRVHRRYGLCLRTVVLHDCFTSI